LGRSGLLTALGMGRFKTLPDSLNREHLFVYWKPGVILWMDVQYYICV
jgi:hypothetical protein